MRFGSLFAGIGGLDLGLERAGMKCAWQVEIGEFQRRVLTKHWPDVPKHKDIRDVGRENLEEVDLIAGGFPCQPFSVAGKRRGTEDDRHLWPEMLRVISELKPTWVLGENVPGIIKIFLDQAIADLESEGYTCEPFVIPAVAFDAPHRRDRLFIVAYSFSTTSGGGRVVEKGNRQRRQFPKAEQASLQPRDGQAYSGIAESGSEAMADADQQRLQVASREGVAGVRATKTTFARSKLGGDITKRGTTWLPEPSMGRVAHGVSHRVDRLRGLGNAVVPQVAEFIGETILKASEFREAIDNR